MKSRWTRTGALATAVSEAPTSDGFPLRPVGIVGQCLQEIGLHFILIHTNQGESVKVFILLYGRRRMYAGVFSSWQSAYDQAIHDGLESDYLILEEEVQ